MKRRAPSVPPAIEALHSCAGRRFGYNFYKNTVRARSRDCQPAPSTAAQGD